MASWHLSMLVVISIVLPARRYFTGWCRYALSLCVNSGGYALSCRSEMPLSLTTRLATSRLATAYSGNRTGDQLLVSILVPAVLVKPRVETSHLDATFSLLTGCSPINKNTFFSKAFLPGSYTYI
ncbi:hypothetical protein I5682_00655 [Citrobacter werkmanii]|nr:hypothetical protein [Citrobacter werkmanii]MBJ9871009.1 hypothetical protein [Citrobacter werkmanii]